MPEISVEAISASSVFTAFKATASLYPDNDFLHIPAQACATYSPESLTWRYGEALVAIENLTSAYAQLGLGTGHRVALALENRPEFFLHHLALNAIGVCIIPLHQDSRVDELAFLIGRSEACVVIALKEHLDKVRQAIDHAGENIPCATPDSLDALPIIGKIGERPPPTLDSPAAILFTSGTTGQPKGCVLSNRYFRGWSQLYTGLGNLATLRPGQERLITPLPTNHTNALGCSFMGMVASGGCIVQVDRFSSSNWWQTVRDSRATIIHYLGVMPAMLLNLPEHAKDDFSSQIKFGLGAGVDPLHHKVFEQRFGFPLLEGWAMTETGGAACIMAHKEPRHVGERCLGRPPANLEFRLVDEHGENVPQGDSGELLVRSAGNNPREGFFSEYYGDEKSTADAWEGDYFHTGDIMCLGEDGSLYFVDRRKNIIRRSGENIAAAQVEEALLAQSSVAVCAVTAVPDEFREEEVMALIVLMEGLEPSEQLATEIVKDCLASLSYFKVPGHIGFVPQLPISSTQKIKQGEIRGLCDKVLGSAAHFDVTELKRPNK